MAIHCRAVKNSLRGTVLKEPVGCDVFSILAYEEGKRKNKYFEIIFSIAENGIH